MISKLIYTYHGVITLLKQLHKKGTIIKYDSLREEKVYYISWKRGSKRTEVTSERERNWKLWRIGQERILKRITNISIASSITNDTSILYWINWLFINNASNVRIKTYTLYVTYNFSYVSLSYFSHYLSYSYRHLYNEQTYRCLLSRATVEQISH